ncbi:MAG: AzlD domain-containing protein [Chloroflexi bacterium]|nr:AzlD domain-containing protein [Chloroflexota bacterium]
MSLDLVVLALLMGAVTYPSRALPLLVPGIERLPDAVLTYLRLVGPASLAALAAVNAVVVDDVNGRPALQLGLPIVAVALCLGFVTWRRNLLLGIAAAVIFVALARAVGLG